MPAERTTLTVLISALLIASSSLAVAGVTVTDPSGESTDAEGSLTVASLTAPDSVAPGETVTVTATVENTGEEAVTETVEFRLGGTVIDSESVTVEADSQSQVSFEANTSGINPGEYTHGVLTETDGQFATLTLSESYTVENLTAPANATSGDNITVEADVANPNDFEATQQVNYRFSGGVASTQDLTLEAGTSETVSLNVTLNGLSEGNYTHGLFTRDAGQLATIEVAAANVSDENTSVSISDQSSDGTSVVVDNVTVPRGGIVAIHDASLLDGNVVGSVIGASDKLAPGTHDNVTIELFDFPGSVDAEELEGGEMTVIAMPHLDTNGNGLYDFVRTEGAADGPYVTNGSAVVDDANLTVETDDGGPPEEVPPEGAPPENETDDEMGENESDDGMDDGMNGDETTDEESPDDETDDQTTGDETTEEESSDETEDESTDDTDETTTPMETETVSSILSALPIVS